MAFSNRMTKYEAPAGYVYDWAVPHYITQTDENGQEIQVQDHLYVKFLFLTKRDTIEAYTLVPAPKGE